MPITIRALQRRSSSAESRAEASGTGSDAQLEITITPPRRVSAGWLLQLLVVNRGVAGTFVADVTTIVGTPRPPENLPLSLGWRHHETTPRQQLARDASELLRLTVVHRASPSPCMTVLSADASADNSANYEVTPGRQVVICVALRNAENGRTMATRNVAILPRVEVDAPPDVRFFGAGAADGSPGPATLQRFAADGTAPRTSSAIAPTGRDVSKTTSTQPVSTGPMSAADGPQRSGRVELEPRPLSDEDARFFGDVLRCSDCSAAYHIRSTEIVCRGCGIRYPVIDGIPVLNKESTIGTLLEETDYDAVGQVTDKLVLSIGADWKNIIADLGVPTDQVLEIGSGTGVLTRGLLEANCVGHVTATDVSAMFLRTLARRTDEYDTAVSLVVCDANDSNFRAEAFDLVLGRSILHHLLHYDQTLRQCNAMLKPGGAAVFFEPILQGKIFLTLLLAQILRCDELSGDPQLSPIEVARVRRMMGHHLKAKIYPQDFASLARLEDKYVFDIDDLRRVGADAGFSRVDYLNNGTVDPTMWPLLAWNLKGIDVDPLKIARYHWVGEEFANTYGLMFGDRIASPMAYFVFHK